ncbi:hypothetical protein GCM10012275_54410 [Longimycelium tulufanense]|uniref:Minor tail protein n=1 Tax=Longimycelium tulufanense TaxID=907463 RepID=A0A8J3FYL8_9PSEU|nr:hypothetical protein [Longimycelium tulufanense]GGM76862.1 hypothetical protein GCM10012275_54410 [Longimycelium tulufanense]
MPAPIYTYLVADLRTNTILDELPLTGVKFTKPLNDSGQLNATWKLDTSNATTRRNPYDLTMPARRCLYALRDGHPIWGGIIWTRRYTSTEQTVSIGAGEFWSYFDHRKVLPVLTSTAIDHIASRTVSYTNTEQNQIARNLVALAQSHTGGDILIETDSTSTGIFRDRTYHGHELREVGDTLRQLCNVLSGPDMAFDVAPGTGIAPRRVLRLGTPRLGQQGSAHVWESGGNVLDYVWPSDATRMTTRAYAAGEGVDLGIPIAYHEDTSRYDAGYPLLESERTYTGVVVEQTLRDHAEADQTATRLPVALPVLTLRGDTPPTAAEVTRGDDGRVLLGPDLFFPHRIDTTMRVIDITIAPGDDAERLELTMAPLLDDVA